MSSPKKSIPLKNITNFYATFFSTLTFLAVIVKNHHFRAPVPYLFLVASPPRICLSALFFSSTSRASRYSPLFTLLSLSVISLCTVDLDIPKFLAVTLTVAPCKTINLAKISHRSPQALFSHASFPKASTEKFPFTAVVIAKPPYAIICEKGKNNAFFDRSPLKVSAQAEGTEKLRTRSARLFTK